MKNVHYFGPSLRVRWRFYLPALGWCHAYEARLPRGWYPWRRWRVLAWTYDASARRHLHTFDALVEYLERKAARDARLVASESCADHLAYPAHGGTVQNQNP